MTGLVGDGGLDIPAQLGSLQQAALALERPPLGWLGLHHGFPRPFPLPPRLSFTGLAPPPTSGSSNFTSYLLPGGSD